MNSLLSVRGTCKALREASDSGDVYRACRVEELPNLVACPFEVAKFMNFLFVHRNLDILFFRGIRTMFLKNHYLRGLKLLEEAMEARNPKATYLFCMLELLRGADLESDDVERVFRLLGFSWIGYGTIPYDSLLVSVAKTGNCI